MTAIPDVLTSARYVAERAQHLRINENAARRWAEAHRADDFPPLQAPPELQFDGDLDDCANLALLLSCLNFCFWSDRPWSVEFRGKTWNRTHAMYAAVLRGVEEQRSWLSPRRWAEADERSTAHLFRGSGQIPLLAERRAVLNETGRCLSEHFEAGFGAAVQQVDGHAARLAYLLADRFPSFRDVARYAGREIAFLKRAQICTVELHRLWQQSGHAGLTGLDELTVFADYRLPQYLRHAGILELDPRLAALIDRRQEIPAGDTHEVELRGASIWSAEIIRCALGVVVPGWRLDFTLWQRSHDPDVRVEHHRTRSVYY